MKIIPLPDRILGTVYIGERKIGNIIVVDDLGKLEGNRPRWTHVYAVGKKVDDIKPGQWILVASGRWTEHCRLDLGESKLTRVAQIDYEGCLIVQDEKPPEIDDSEVLTISDSD